MTDPTIVYERASWNTDHTMLVENEIRRSDGSRSLERRAKTGDGDVLRLFVEEDPIESQMQYGVNWRGLCGYHSASIHTATEKDAVKLFKALQKVTGYDLT